MANLDMEEPAKKERLSAAGKPFKSRIAGFLPLLVPAGIVLLLVSVFLVSKIGTLTIGDVKLRVWRGDSRITTLSDAIIHTSSGDIHIPAFTEVFSVSSVAGIRTARFMNSKKNITHSLVIAGNAITPGIHSIGITAGADVCFFFIDGGGTQQFKLSGVNFEIHLYNQTASPDFRLGGKGLKDFVLINGRSFSPISLDDGYEISLVTEAGEKPAFRLAIEENGMGLFRWHLGGDIDNYFRIRHPSLQKPLDVDELRLDILYQRLLSYRNGEEKVTVAELDEETAMTDLFLQSLMRRYEKEISRNR
jgi:hypothetical protein